MINPSLLDRFSSIVGETHAIRAGDPAQARYLEEPRGNFHGATPLVLRPGSVDEVQAILRLADATLTPITPQSGNTGLVGGQTPSPDNDEIALSLDRLDRVRAIDPQSNTLIVEAGVTLQRTQQAATSVDRLFPLRLASEGSCRIGGNLSTNAGGTAVLAYGNARDLVLGLEVVLADGRLWSGLRTLRKDNTGYDLKHLFIGAEGTLGIITAASLKLYPRPSAQSTALVGASTIGAIRDLFELARVVAGPSLTAFEVLPRLGLDFLVRHLERARDPLSASHAWYALVEIAGFAGGDPRAEMETLLERALGDGAADDAVVASSEAQAAELWRLRELLSEIQKKEGASLKHDVSVPVAKIPELIERGNALIIEAVPGARPLPFGHFGDGNIHYNVSQPVGMQRGDFQGQWDRISGIVYGLVTELGGSISAEHGIGRLKRQLLQSVKSPVELQLMHALKQALDPRNILNRDRVL